MEFTKDPSTHPANGPITEERLREIAALPTKTLTDGRQVAHGVISTVRTIEVVKMARQLLDSMEQEPVAEIVSIYGDPEAFGEREIKPLVGIQKMPYGTKLYAAPQLPQPAVLEGLYKIANHIASCKGGMPEEWQDWAEEIESDIRRISLPAVPDKMTAIVKDENDYVEGWNACRAAMLQSAEPVRQPLAFFDGDISAEDAEKIIARLREMNSKPGSQQVMIAEPVSQPYTLRDGWVAVPVEPTEEMLDEFDSIIDYGAEDSKDAWSRLIAAAPQQEVRNGR